MRSLICLITLLLFTILGYAAENIAVVDMENVYRNYYKTQAQSAEFEKQKEVYKNYSFKLKKNVEELKAKAKELSATAENTMLKESIRKEKKALAERFTSQATKKETQMVEYNQKKFSELQVKSDKMRENIIAEVKEKVREFSILNDIKVVIDKSANNYTGIDSVIYYDPSTDITKRITDQLNGRTK